MISLKILVRGCGPLFYLRVKSPAFELFGVFAARSTVFDMEKEEVMTKERKLETCPVHSEDEEVLLCSIALSLTLKQTAVSFYPPCTGLSHLSRSV